MLQTAKAPSDFLFVFVCVWITADSTGTHSVYTTYQGYEIMFHVSTMLPYMPNNPQQVRVKCSSPQRQVAFRGFWMLQTLASKY